MQLTKKEKECDEMQQKLDELKDNKKKPKKEETNKNIPRINSKLFSLLLLMDEK